MGAMTDLTCLHTKGEVERLCRRPPYVHLYALGDLEEFFWPQTVWYARRDVGDGRPFVLVYLGCSMPTVLAIAEPPIEPMRDLLHGLLPLLPRRFYAHLSEGLADVL